MNPKPRTFRLRLEWREGTTHGDRIALLDAFEREIVEVYGLQSWEVLGAPKAIEVTYGFRERINADASVRRVGRWGIPADAHAPTCPRYRPP